MNTYDLWRRNVRRWHHSAHWQLRDSGDCIHSHGNRMAVLGLTIFGGAFTRDDLVACALHDQPESWTGDVSYDAKRYHGEIAKAHDIAETFTTKRFDITCAVSPRVKMIDGLDCTLWQIDRAPMLTHLVEWVEHRNAVLDQAAALSVADHVSTIYADAMRAAGVGK